jgi:hypothetical protein
MGKLRNFFNDTVGTKYRLIGESMDLLMASGAIRRHAIKFEKFDELAGISGLAVMKFNASDSNWSDIRAELERVFDLVPLTGHANDMFVIRKDRA